ncbi:MAG: DMT family transporter [Lewinella sp.]|nr:DMT family transporter [Lewinella sp.]
MQKKIFLAHLGLLAVALIYGGNYSVAKLVMDPGYLSPETFILLRISSGVLLFGLFHRLLIREKVERRHLGRLALCGLFGAAANMLLFFKGLHFTTPISASLIMTLTPALVLVSSALLLGEHITRRKVLGILVGGLGAGWLILAGKEMAFAPRQWLGNLLVLANATAFGLYLVLVRSLAQRYHPITIVSWVFFFGWLMVLPLTVRGLWTTDWSALTTGAWVAVGYVLLGTTFLTYLLNALALRTVPASTVSIYIYLQPLFAVIIALSMGKDQLDVVKIGSGLLIFLGVFLVSWRRHA